MKLTLTLAALLIASPAYALTLDQAQAELAGMHCSGSTCTASTTNSTTVQNPDIVTTTRVQTAPARSGNTDHLKGPTFTDAEAYRKGGWWNERCQTYAYVNSDCATLSIADHGSAATYRTVTVVTSGGTSVVQSCTTVTKELTYNGPNTDRAGAWSVDTSSSSSDGAC